MITLLDNRLNYIPSIIRAYTIVIRGITLWNLLSPSRSVASLIISCFLLTSDNVERNPGQLQMFQIFRLVVSTCARRFTRRL